MLMKTVTACAARPFRALKTLRRSGLARDKRGVAMIELGITLPFMVLLGFGGLEIASLTLANTRMSQIALSTADNASRIAFGSGLSLPRVREVDINDVFRGAELQADGLELGERGRVILSSLEQNPDGGQWIRWQRCYGDMDVDSAYGVQGTGATGTAFPGMGPEGREVTADMGTAVMFVEIIYEYKPLLYGKWLGPKEIRSTAAFNIREARDMSQVYNPNPAAVVANCN